VPLLLLIFTDFYYLYRHDAAAGVNALFFDADDVRQAAVRDRPVCVCVCVCIYY
jgi:hypothetical protein